MEAQALARIHRIGQTKPVTTIRFIMRNSFEEVYCSQIQHSEPMLMSLAYGQSAEPEETSCGSASLTEEHL